MNKKVAAEFRRPGASPPVAVTPWTRRWFGRLALLAISVLLLSLSFAPINQFYLAWIGLVPWLIVIHYTGSQRSAFFWGWVGGTMFFVANMWWMAYLTVPGMFALMSILALYWGLASIVIRGTAVLKFPGLATSAAGSSPLKWQVRESAIAKLLLLACIWASLEWIRGNFIWGGLPWLYLGHTQSSFLTFCQIADITGVYGISFIVVLINGWFAMLLIGRLNTRRLRSAGVLILTITILSICYGVFRISETKTTPGPVVMVVQANYPQDASGNKGATRNAIADFHLRITADAAAKFGRPVDLVVWSETMMPELNRDGRFLLHGQSVGAIADYGRFCDEVFGNIQNLARDLNAHMLVGAEYFNVIRSPIVGEKQSLDRRNSAYYFDRTGFDSDQRYDKIHLVPFGEFLPFKETLPALNKFLLSLTPYDFDYTLTPGPADSLTVFKISERPSDSSIQPASQPTAESSPRSWRFVAPICFEDIFSDGVARMFRPPPGSSEKRADFLVNITNDGWYRAFENAQHVQTALFRSIENRVPTARSVNTGISGFFDSIGRPFSLVPVRTEGVSIAQLPMDRRLTFYTLYDDLFAQTCAVVMIFTILRALVRWKKERKASP